MISCKQTHFILNCSSEAIIIQVKGAMRQPIQVHDFTGCEIRTFIDPYIVITTLFSYYARYYSIKCAQDHHIKVTIVLE